MNILVAADRHWAIGKDGRGLVTIPADQQMLMRETAGMCASTPYCSTCLPKSAALWRVNWSM